MLRFYYLKKIEILRLKIILFTESSTLGKFCVIDLQWDVVFWNIKVFIPRYPKVQIYDYFLKIKKNWIKKLFYWILGQLLAMALLNKYCYILNSNTQKM